jgi:hypothetical protein
MEKRFQFNELEMHPSIFTQYFQTRAQIASNIAHRKSDKAI